jgi:hypothetical protein
MKKIYNSPTVGVIAIHTTALLNGSILRDGDNASVQTNPYDEYGGEFCGREYDFDEDEY